MKQRTFVIDCDGDDCREDIVDSFANGAIRKAREDGWLISESRDLCADCRERDKSEVAW